LLLCSLVASPARAQTLMVTEPSSPIDTLVFDILKLALSKTAPDTTFRLESNPQHEYPWTEAVKQGRLSVMWAGTTLDLERELSPVRIPVLKGLLGYRLFIIRKEDQHRFDRIHTLRPLKQLMAGSGTGWGDSLILQSNGIPVQLAPGTQQLLPMLENGEIDYFPRALMEPWRELEQFASSALVVEQSLLLSYPYPSYFFVAPDNHTLHDQIYRGLEMAIKDGSFDRLFFNDPSIQAMLSRAELGKRTVLRLINPYLSPETPFYREEFWLDPASLQPGCSGERCAAESSVLPVSVH